MNQPYLIVQDGEVLPSGSNVYKHERAALEQLKVGNFREQAGCPGLQQALPAEASVDAFFLTALAAVLERYGNWGYRMAQVEASIRAGWVDLGSYAQRLGASGLTIFDDDVIEFFSPLAKGQSVMFFVALCCPQRVTVP